MDTLKLDQLKTAKAGFIRDEVEFAMVAPHFVTGIWKNAAPRPDWHVLGSHYADENFICRHGRYCLHLLLRRSIRNRCWPSTQYNRIDIRAGARPGSPSLHRSSGTLQS